MPVLPRGAELNIANGVREFAVARPSTVAVVDGERTITYLQLRDRSARLAQALLVAGCRPADRVGVLLGNRLEYCEIAAGLAMAGLTMVPVNPRLTPAEASFILGHSGASALVLDGALSAIAAPWVEMARPIVVSIDTDDLGPGYEAALHGVARAHDPAVAVRETDPFCIAYTSGTTGNPKGVMVSHRSRALTFYATALEWGLGPAKTTIAVAPMYHGAGFAFGYGAVFVGGTVHMMRAFDGERLLHMIATDRPGSVFLVPTHAQMLRALGDDAVDRSDTSSLDTLYFNAAALAYPLKQWVTAHFPTAGVHELYGSTEAGIVTNLRPTDIDKPGSVGPPWFMTEVRVVDDNGDLVTAGTAGELFSRSPFLMNGYLDDDEATAACTTHDGFLSSGDVAVIDDDNYVFIVDRKKDLIISGGANIYPREVEDALVTHPAVADVAVIGLPHAIWGEQVAACLVLRPGCSVTEAELDAHCRIGLGGYKIPRQYTFVDALPRNASGKVLKRELRATVKTDANV